MEKRKIVILFQIKKDIKLLNHIRESFNTKIIAQKLGRI